MQPSEECVRRGSPPTGCKRLDFNTGAWWRPALTKDFWMLASRVSEDRGDRQSLHTAFRTSMGNSSAEFMSHNLAHEAIVEARCQIVRSWWNLTPELLGQVAQARSDINSLSRQHQRRNPIIAIQARGGDKRSEAGAHVLDPKTLQYAMEHGLKRLIKTHPGLEGATCIVVGDGDMSYTATLIGQARSILNCSSVIAREGGKGPWVLMPEALPPLGGRGHIQGQFNSMSLEERCSATKQFMVDLEVMGWADYLVTNEKSNVAEVAYLLR